MMRSTVLTIVAALATATGVSAACRPIGTQLQCNVGPSHVVIGTQAAQPGTRAPLPVLSLNGDGGFADDAAPPHRFEVQVQNFGRDPSLCRTIGNETYCY